MWFRHAPVQLEFAIEICLGSVGLRRAAGVGRRMAAAAALHVWHCYFLRLYGLASQFKLGSKGSFV